MNRDWFDLELLQNMAQLSRAHRSGNIVFKDERSADSVDRGIHSGIRR